MNQIQTQNKIIENECCLYQLDELKGKLMYTYCLIEDSEKKKEIEELIGEIKDITDKVRIRGAKAVDNLRDKIIYFHDRVDEVLEGVI